MADFKERDRWIKSEEIEEKIMKIIMESDLGYWEILGMLQHMQMEFHRMGDEMIKQKEDFESS